MAPRLATSLSKFVNAVHRQLGGNNTVEEITAAHLENGGRDALALDGPLNGGDIEDRILNTLSTSQQIDRLIITPRMEAGAAEDVLRKVIPTMPNLKKIDIAMEMNESQAERILEILQTSPTMNRLVVYLENTTGGIARPLAKYLCESSSLKLLGLTWMRQDGESGPSLAMSEAALTSICTGIGQSKSLRYIMVSHPPTEEVASFIAAKRLAHAANTASSSLKGVKIKTKHRTFAEQVRKALLGTEALHNLGLCFREDEDEHYLTLTLNRSAPWKPLLSQDVPLNYWPRILAKTNTWAEETSHHPVDALYFLVKEKCDVLLQNVHRRRIRKRKRSQFYTPS